MKYYFLSTIFLLGFGFSTLKAEDISKKVESLRIEVNSLKVQKDTFARNLMLCRQRMLRRKGKYRNFSQQIRSWSLL